MTLRLELAEVSDLNFVQDCATTAYEKYVERIGKKPAPMIADFESHIRRGEVEIVLWDDKPAGYCVSFNKGDALFIENIALHPAHQGKGLAVMIFEALEVRARQIGLEKLTLYTNEKMHENLGLYPKLGFVETERCQEGGFHRVFFEKQVSQTIYRAI